VAVCGTVDWWRQETWSARGDLLSARLEEPDIRANLEIILLGLKGCLRCVMDVGASRCRVPVGDLKIEAGVGSLAKVLVHVSSCSWNIRDSRSGTLSLRMNRRQILPKNLGSSPFTFCQRSSVIRYRRRFTSFTMLSSRTQTYVMAVK
jgi:hypothetical protein